MAEESQESPVSPTNPPAAFRVRLPGFLVRQEVGLGDAIKKVTGTFGIKPCGGCQRRAATLNRWMSFRGGKRQ